jgi:2-haloacid dehalogenase
VLDFTRFRIFTFDCYGTLIDWETGILAALRPILARHNVQLADETVLELYGELEAEAESGPYRSYRDVLESVARGIGARLGFTSSDAEAKALPESLKDWRPFPDTVAALRQLAARFQLAIISNIDDDLFVYTAPLLGAPLAHVITAQQVRSYKPSHNNFQVALERIGLPKDQVLHVAQSLFHDVEPARALGLASVWVNRRAGREGAGATRRSHAQPDLEVPDLRTLAALATG